MSTRLHELHYVLIPGSELLALDRQLTEVNAQPYSGFDTSGKGKENSHPDLSSDDLFEVTDLERKAAFTVQLLW